MEQLRNELEATVAQQQEISGIWSRVKGQRANQKVSAQLAAASPSGGGLEASKFAIGRIRGGGPAPQVVNNPKAASGSLSRDTTDGPLEEQRQTDNQRV